jgi:hypothetical protein
MPIQDVSAADDWADEARMQLEANYTFEAGNRTCVIDASGEVGRDFNQLFLGFMRREFGRGAFQVKRVASSPSAAA